MRDLREKTVRTETIYEGKIITVDIEHVKLPNGNRAKREIVRHPGAVAAIAITPNNRLILVRQYRKPLDKTIFEIPAGKLEKGEDPMECASRELMEETGYRAERMNYITSFYTSPGFADELLHIYEAEGLICGESKPDADEFVDVIEMGMEEAFERIRQRDIIDAKTIFAVYYWQNNMLKRNALDE